MFKYYKTMFKKRSCEFMKLCSCGQLEKSKSTCVILLCALG